MNRIIIQRKDIKCTDTIIIEKLGYLQYISIEMCTDELNMILFSCELDYSERRMSMLTGKISFLHRRTNKENFFANTTYIISQLPMKIWFKKSMIKALKAFRTEKTFQPEVAMNRLRHYILAYYGI